MLVYLLIVAIVNLGVGYLLGVALAPRPLPSRERQLPTDGLRSEIVDDDPPREIPSETPREPAAKPSMETPAAHNMPSSFSDEAPQADDEPPSSAPPTAAAEIGEEPAADEAAVNEVAARAEEPAAVTTEAADDESSPVAASLQEFHTGLAVFRERIAQLDGRVRRCAAAPTVAEIEGCVSAVREAGSQYLHQLQPATDRLAARRSAEGPGNEGPGNELDAQLHAALEAQAQAVQTAAARLNKLDLVDNLPGSCQSLLEAVDGLSRESDQRREQIAAFRRTLEASLADAQAPSAAAAAAAPVSTRDAWEARLAALRSQDPEAGETLLAGMIDIDHLSRRADDEGGDISAQALAAVGQVIHALAGEQTRVAHIADQQFALLFEEGDVDAAVAEVERMRQSLEVAQMEHEGQPIQITASCAVAKIKPDDTPDQLFERLLRTIRESKQDGQSPTFVPEDEADPALAR